MALKIHVHFDEVSFFVPLLFAILLYSPIEKNH